MQWKPYSHVVHCGDNLDQQRLKQLHILALVYNLNFLLKTNNNSYT